MRDFDNFRARSIAAGVVIGLFLVTVGVIAITALGGRATQAPTDDPATFSASERFAALSDGTLSPAPQSIVSEFRAMHGAAAADNARTIGPGMYITSYGDVACGAFHPGGAGCTKRLDGGIWLLGDMVRAYDSESAPFKVDVYGLAEDGVTSIDVTLGDGREVSIPVSHNGFRSTFEETTFAEVLAMRVNYASGELHDIDPTKYFPGGLHPRLRRP